MPEVRASVTVTPRQAQVLDALCEGLSQKQIARRLGISMQTVKNHLDELFAKTGRRGSVALAVWWVEHRAGVSAPGPIPASPRPDPPGPPAARAAPDLDAEIERHIVRGDGHECWLWDGPMNDGVQPYVRWRGRKVYVRRHLYEGRYGLQGIGRVTVARERCGPGLWQRCVNPEHATVGRGEHWRRARL